MLINLTGTLINNLIMYTLYLCVDHFLELHQIKVIPLKNQKDYIYTNTVLLTLPGHGSQEHVYVSLKYQSM